MSSLSTDSSQTDHQAPSGTVVCDEVAVGVTDGIPADVTQTTTLPLTPFERYMVVDARRGYPMTYPLEFRIAGTLDRQRLTGVFGEAVRHHPLLSARITRAGWNLGCAPPELEWFDQSAVLPAVGIPIDPATEPLIRVRVFCSAEQTTLQFIVHHALTDGSGLSQFAFDLINSYRGIPKRRPNPDPVGALARRAEYHFTPPAVISRWQSRRFVFKESMRFAWKRPHIFGEKQTLDNVDAPVALLSRTLEPETVAALTTLTKEADLSLNTLLLAITFHTLAIQSPSAKPSSTLRITVPISMRQRQDLRLSAANKIGYAFIDRTMDQCSDLLSLAAGLQTEVKAILDWSLAGMFNQAIGAIDRFPGGLHAVTRLSRRASTAVFSNLGDVGRRFRVPKADAASSSGDTPDVEARVDSICGAPPVRPGTAVAIGVVLVHGKLTLSLSRDPRRLSEIQGQQLLDRYIDTCHDLLKESVG